VDGSATAKKANEQLANVQDKINSLWLKVPAELVANLVDSMPERKRACYKARGGHIPYLKQRLQLDNCMRPNFFTLFS
jgi:hypothetical protein